MADRYWVGGTGTWNTTSTTNWSASSGGASGASVPTVADNVIFDQAGTYTVTMTGALACLDITVSAGTVTFATGTSPSLDVRGSMSLLAGTVWSSTGAITFSSTSTGRTVTTNGVTIPGTSSSLFFNGVGGEWTLGSALTAGTSVSPQLLAGTLKTNGFTLTGFSINSTGSLVRSFDFGSSLINPLTPGTSLNFSGTNLTIVPGTSTINVPGSITSPGLNFNNVTFSNTGAGTRNITGINTFNNLTFTRPASAGVITVTFAAQQTINGTLSTTGTAGNRRVFFTTANYGISRDLVVNSAPSLTDADFRGIYVTGSAAPISGTRIGNRGECRGITFSTPKTVYWNLSGAQNWSANGWATTSTGSPSTDNFPLPQDTATFTDAGSVTGTITLDTAIGYVPTVDMSGRTTAMTLGTSNATTVYGNWTNGSGTAFTGASALTFSGGTTQTITSAGKTFTCPITVDTYGGTVQLADALNIGTQNLTVTNGTFNTSGYAVNIGNLSSSNSNVRTINLGASTVTIVNTIFPIFLSAVNLAFNAGTSTVAVTYNAQGFGTVNLAGVTFYNFNFLNTNSNEYNLTFSGVASTFNNLSFSFPNGTILVIVFQANQTINGTLTCAGASAVRRIFLQSDTIGTPRTLTVNSISATDCDFRDINLAGAASGASPTRAGDCGGNTGITFPAAKTVYWNLSGAQNWSATAWAPGSGGTPDINNFPLAQDTAVFDNTGSVTGTITINAAWNIGTFDASLRTSAMTLSTSTNAPVVYGDWKFGTGVTSSSTTGTITFSKNGTQTITSNGVQFGCPVTINHPSANVQLADAISLGGTRTLTLTAGTFDAVTYNVTAGSFSSASATTTKMGSGTWTLSGTGTVWTGAGTNIAGTSTIVLSDTSTTARTFAGGGLYYNKLTIGGTTGTSTLTISSSNTFGELASTKTVAHTITFPLLPTNIGKWSVTGTLGNVVTVNSSAAGTAFTLSIAGPANSGIDYLSVRDCTVATTSPGEFYVGANSTNVSGNTRVIFTATPAPRTLYWVGGTGNWSSTTKWSTSSGGGSGAAIPTSLDAVNFDSLSNATAYTATIDAGVTLARCASFTMAGPASGNVTFAGTVGIAFHGNVSFAATGITRTYTGAMNWAGNSSYTFITNGLTLGSACTVIGIGSTWTLGSALTSTSDLFVTYGSLDTSGSNYAITVVSLVISNSNVRSVSFNGSTVTVSVFTSGALNAGTINNLTFNAGTSQITLSGNTSGIASGGLTFYNVSFTSVAATSATITGANTFNNLTFAGNTLVGRVPITFSANQTINGTLTLNAGTAAAFRTFLASNTLGTTRTLTCAAVSLTDVDFRDITIAGAAAPASGTRLGDAKGNSGITFDAAKTVYYRQTGSANWGATGSGSWSATSGGALDATQFPLAQDTAVFPAATYPASGSTTTINAAYNIGTIDMSLRTTNTMTLATGSTTPQIYGNWINGTGTTLTGTGAMTFAGRTTQQITSAGRTFTQDMIFSTPGGSITLLDAYTNNRLSGTAIQQIAGTFNANGYNVTLSSGGFFSNSSFSRTAAIGSGTWVLGASGGGGWTGNATGLTVTGTGTISLTSASGKQFTGGGANYSGITLNQGGAGALTITGNNTFKNITNTYSATGATSIALDNTTQTLTNPWTATGEATRVLTISGTSAASPGTLIFNGAGQAASVDYLTINNVRAYPLATSWYAGANSTNGGSLGWYFSAPGGVTYAVTITETGTGTDSIVAKVTYLGSVAETGTGTDSVTANLTYLGSIAETGTGTDSIVAGLQYLGEIAESGTLTDSASAVFIPLANITESSTASEVAAAILTALSNISETGTGSDAVSALMAANSSLAETATATDTDSAQFTAGSSISESATATDAVTALATLLSAVSESATADDLISSIKGLFAYIVETATGTDSINAPGSTYNPQLVETATGTDSLAALAIFATQVVEAATAADVIAAFKAYLATILETASGADAAFARFVARSAISETATGTDSDVAILTAQSSVAETATGTDQISALRALAAQIAESITLYEGSFVGTNYDSPGAGSWTVPAGVTTAIFELWGGGAGGTEGTPSGDGSGGGGGAYAKKTSTVTPGASISFTVGSGGSGEVNFPAPIPASAGTASTYSTVTAGGGAVGGAGGTATGGDVNVSGGSTLTFVGGNAAAGGGSGGATGGANGSVPGGGGAGGVYTGGFFNDPGGSGASGRVRISYLAKSPSAQAVFRGLMQEIANLTDSAIARATFQSLIAETSTAQDIVRGFMVAAVQISELTTGADQISALRALAAAVVETVSGTDTVSAQSIFRGILQEITTLTDTVNAPGSTYSAPIVELATLQDVVASSTIFPVSITESATGTQTDSAQFVPQAIISETATVTDTATAVAAFVARLLESVLVTDVTAPPGSIYNPVILVSASLADEASPPGSIYNATVLALATVSSSLVAEFLWNLIGDAQDPSWGTINAAQANLWALGDVAQESGWQVLNDAQTPGWQQIAGESSPDWQLIDKDS